MKLICNGEKEMGKEEYPLRDEVVDKQTYHLFLSYLYSSKHLLDPEQRFIWNMR